MDVAEVFPVSTYNYLHDIVQLIFIVIPFLSHPPAPVSVTTLGVAQIERFT